MKGYKVFGKSVTMNVEFNCSFAEDAARVYQTLLDSRTYYSGGIVDNHTGEVYANFERSIEAGGEKLESWVAAE